MMKNKELIERMAKDTGISIEEATKALNGLMGKGLIKPSGKKFPFAIDMGRVAEIAGRLKNGNRR